jgi:hypothetical protein|tara:strand:- start:65 stop:358 length:294 start_codon:yes stop_codon:yes gene_type:complete
MTFTKKTNATSTCPVTIAITYSANLDIRVKTQEGTVPMSYYQAYGSRAGFMLPPQTTEIIIASKLISYPLSLYIMLAGVLGIFYLAFRAVSWRRNLY